jgi:parallel beta-helix repeat protein
MKNISFVLVAVFILIFFPITLFSDLNDDLLYSLDDLTFTKYEDYDVVELRGCDFTTRYIGAPDLPATAISFLIPQDKKVKKVNFINVERVKVPGTYDIIPKQPPQLTDGSPPPPFVEPEPWYYLSTFPYPILQYEIIEDGFRSEYRIVTLRIYPLIYIPFAQSLWLSTHIQMELELEQDVNWGVPVKRRSEVNQRTIERLIKAMVVNPEDVDGYGVERFIEEGNPDLNKLEITDSPSLQGSCVDYIIITSDGLKQSFQELADWKMRKGIVSLVKSLSWIDEYYTGCDRQERIRNFIKDAHTNWGTDYFLLGGDTDILPIRTVDITGSWFPDCPSDLYYSDLEGTWNENCNSIFGELPLYIDILGLDFVDKDNGWCVHSIGPTGIFRTYNGGVDWEIQDGSGYGISAVSVDSAWVVGYATILRTTNGGKDWETQTLPPGIEENCLRGIYFRNCKEGWVVGNRYILHTSDAGLNWEIQYDFGGMDSTFEDVQFADEMNGWAVGHYDNSDFAEKKPLIYHTSNGGTDWFPQRDTYYESLYGIYVVDPFEAWAVGDSSGFEPGFTKGLILHTTDGGLTWEKQTFDGLLAFTDIVFVSTLEGWVSNIEGRLYHTTDGGNFWYEEESFPVTLKVIDFFGLQDGWTAGRGICLHTTNGGVEWTQFHFPQLGDTSTQEYEPDVFVARAPVKNVELVETFSNKVLCYEKTPPMDDDYLNRILFLTADMGSGIGYDGLIKKEDFQDIGINPWYPAEFFHKYEMYGPWKDPDPGNPQYPRWEGDEEISRTGVIGRMNRGYHFINHMDHSGPYIMGTYYINGEQINRNDVDALVNANKTSIIWTYGCYAGAFQYDGICEHFMNNPNGGAVAFIGNVKSGVAGQWNQDFRFFRSIFGDNNYNLGVAFSTTQGPSFHFPHSANMHLLGDPEMPVWTDNPKPLQVIKPNEIEGFGTHTIEITVMDPTAPEPEPIEGALVCLQKGEEAYARRFTDENGEATFTYKPESAGEILVTVTAQNFLPYEDIIDVIPPAVEEPYVCFDSEIIDDDNEGVSIGNGDGIVNPSETIEMDIILRNNGMAMAHDVQAIFSLAGIVPYVTVIEDSQSFGNIPQGETSQSSLPYVFAVSSDCEPGYEIHFHLRIKQGPINCWYDDFVVKVLADSLIQTRHAITFNDVNGNGKIDPDEEVYIDSLEITNYGDGGADDVEATLSPEVSGITMIKDYCFIGDIPGFSYVTIQPELEPHCFVFSCNPVPKLFKFTLTLKDRFGREWQQKVDLSAPNPPDSVWSNLFGQDFSNLIWDYENVSKDFDISGYNIYRSFSENGSFERANPMPQVSFSLYNDFPLSYETEHWYKIRAVDSSGNESSDSPILHTKTNPPFLQGWPKIFPKVTDGNWSSAKIGDIDGDGDMEIVMGYRNVVYAYHHDGCMMSGWPKELDNESPSSPALADLNNDGTLEIVYCGGENEKLYVWKYNGQNFSEQWPLKFEGQYVKGSPLIADLEGDGMVEIIVCVDNRIYAYHPDGSSVAGNWLGGVPVDGSIDSRFVPSIADLDGDGIYYEVIACSFEGLPDNKGYVYAIDYLGNIIENWPYTFQNSQWSLIVTSPSVADFDGIQGQEVVVANLIPGRVFLLDNNGNKLWENKYGDNAISSTPGIADLNCDGNLDIFFATFHGIVGGERSYLHVVDYENGDNLLSVSFNSMIRSSPIYDGKRIVVATSDGKAHFLNMDGTEELGSPFFNGQPGDIYSTPSIYDIDLDGDIEVTYSGIDKRMYVWDPSTILNQSAAVWSVFKHDNWNTGNYDFVVPETFMSTDKLATACNNQRKIVDKDKIGVAYSSMDKVFFSTAQDGNGLGQRWIVGDGKFPALARYSDVTAQDFLGTVWVKNGGVYYSRYTDETGWSEPYPVIVYVGGDIHFAPPSFTIDELGTGHLVWEKIAEPENYPGYINYELHYSTFDARLEEPSIVEDDILDEATEWVNQWNPEYASASLALDDNNPVVAWSRAIGGGKNTVYFKQKTGGVWPEEPDIVSSPEEISQHPFCDVNDGVIHIVWEVLDNDTLIKYRQRGLIGWSDIETVSDPVLTSHHPQLLGGDICVYSEFPMVQPDHCSNVVYRKRLPNGDWLSTHTVEFTSFLSEYPQSYIEKRGNLEILHTVWTEGSDAPYEVRYKKTTLPLQFSGHIVENTVWDSDIYITGDVVIDSGVTLTVNPGVRVMFVPLYDDTKLGIDNNRCEFIVEGKLTAEGSETDSIYFTSAGIEAEMNDWYGIRFTPLDSKPRRITNVKMNNLYGMSNIQRGKHLTGFLSSEVSSIDYANISYANTGITCQEHSSPTLQNISLSENNTGIDATQASFTVKNSNIFANYAGIYCNSCTGAVIDSCDISNNPPSRLLGKGEGEEIMGFRNPEDTTQTMGTGIYLVNCDSVVITNNRIVNDYKGIYATGFVNGIFQNNYVKDNEWHGFDIAVIEGSQMQFLNNTFINNAKYPVNHNMDKKYYREFAGLSLAFPGVHTGETDVIVMGNTFSGNTCGTRFSKYYAMESPGTYNVRYEGNVSENNFYGFALSAPSGASGYTGTFVYNTAESNDSAGVFVWFGVDSGAVNLGNLENNIATDNGANHITGNGAWEVMNICPYILYAQGNFWGTTDSLEIDSHIYDDDENPDCGMVDFGGYAISGELPEDEIWEGFVYICGDILVPEDITLTIVEGATICFVANYDVNNLGVDEGIGELIVEGNLEVRPNVSLSRVGLTGASRFTGLSIDEDMDDGPPVYTPILFTSDAYTPSPSDWYGIELGGLNWEDRPQTRDPRLKTKDDEKIWSSETSIIFSPSMEENKRGGEILKQVQNDTIQHKDGLPTLSYTEWYMTPLSRVNYTPHREERDVHYFEIEYAKRGLALCEREMLSMKNCVFRDNEAGLKLRGNSLVTIKGCVFRDNTSYGIYAGDGVTGTIKDDSLYNNGVGLIVQGNNTIHPHLNPLPSRERIKEILSLDSGGKKRVERSLEEGKILSPELALKGVYIAGNGTGILCGGESKPTIKENKIVDNSEYGVYITDDAKPNLGGKGHNKIYGSGLYDLYNNTDNKIMAKKNYWGTMNIDTVLAHIWDYYDDNSLGIVEVKPLWDGNKGIGGAMTAGTENRFIYCLKHSSPNPFANNTSISYSIAKPGKVSLNVYDVSGRLVRRLVDEKKNAGIYTVRWSGNNEYGHNVSTGVYFMRLVAGDFISVKKIILVR